MDSTGPEIFIALAGAVGTDLDLVFDVIRGSLGAVGYSSSIVHLSKVLVEVTRCDVPDAPLDKHIESLMNEGDKFRQQLDRSDAMGLLGISAIQRDRGTEPKSRHAYVLRSLKHPKEVDLLRQVYGANFVLLAAYSPFQMRLNGMAQRIAVSRGEPLAPDQESARRLLQRDQEDSSNPWGQRLQDTFHLADAFVDASNPERLKSEVGRFVELWFGNTFHTPTRHEHAMFIAQAAAYRSAELGRQVGAAIASDGGDVVAVGCNEVPHAGGGLYWPGDLPDQREFQRGFDSNDAHKLALLEEIRAFFLEKKWLTPGTPTAEDLMHQIPRGLRIRNLIEFGRAVHAEMAAIVEAARRGASVAGCSMYVTTFPCHLCARHIVAAGLRKVWFIEPYPRSLASELYPDSIGLDESEQSGNQVIFQPFVGIAPLRYLELFRASGRKDSAGKVIPFKGREALPRLVGQERLYLNEEKAALVMLDAAIRSAENST